MKRNNNISFTLANQTNLDLVRIQPCIIEKRREETKKKNESINVTKNMSKEEESIAN